MKLAREVRIGNVFKLKDTLYVVLKAEFHKSTAGRRASTSEMKMKLMDLTTKNRTDMTVDATSKVDVIILDRTPSQFLYKTDGQYFFMNQGTFEQFEINEASLGDAVHYLKEDGILDVMCYEESPVSVDLPHTMDMKITYTEPGLRGDTTGKATKPATLESGYELQVPLFCNIGDMIKVNTTSGEYMERA